ncbi:MAG TPA: DNA-3-methyladenine glycosylase [Epulopiscium sp.]|nr:DNA-3-methyladenine glycosylase [Candidatus Epulonipiscium sp.]
MSTLLTQSFYSQDALYVAPRLLGKILVRKLGDTYVRCQIVEVEAYAGPHDKAAHVYNNKRTSRTESMFLAGGHTYVYIIYGMHHCLNIVTGHPDKPQGVLIRGVEPLDEASFRMIKQNRPILSKKLSDFTNGPGKLCAALNIDKSLNGYNLISGKELFLEDAHNNPSIVCSPRINIPYAEEYIQKPWRYYIKDNPYVSVMDPNSIFYQL